MRWKTIFGVAIAFVLGFGVGWVLRAPVLSPETFVTSSDLDLGATFFFSEHPDGPPIQGTLKAGSEIIVTFRKGAARYIRLNTVIDEDTLAWITQPGDPAQRLVGEWLVDFAAMEEPYTFEGVAYEFGEDGSFAVKEGEEHLVGTWRLDSVDDGRLKITANAGGSSKKVVVEFVTADRIRMWHVDHPIASFPLKRR